MKRRYNISFNVSEDDNGEGSNGQMTRQIFGRIQTCMQKKDFSDFRVVVGDRTFQCHRVLLSACSPFFMAACQLDMLEGNTRLVQLVNMTPEVFDVIYSVVYTGQLNVNESNAVDVWQASHFLQISFVVESCEHFLENSLTLDNYEDIAYYAQLYDSETLTAAVYQFMMNNFTKIWQSEMFLQITFKQLMSMIKSEDLNVDSEDIVLKAIFRWISRDEKYSQLENTALEKPDDYKRQKNSNVDLNKIKTESFLLPLLRSSRFYLASLGCLMELNENLLVQNDSRVSTLFSQAISFQAEHSHGFYPTMSCYRNSSQIRHCGVVGDHSGLWAMCLRDVTWYQLPICPAVPSYTSLTVFDNELYVLGNRQGNMSALYVLRNRTWHEVVAFMGRDMFLLSHGPHIYAFNRSNGLVSRLNIKSDPVSVLLIKCVGMQSPQLAIGLKNEILIFSASELGDKTAVFGLDMRDDHWSTYGHIDGPAENMVSFRTDDNHYVLQTDGTLLEVRKLPGETPVFNVVYKMLLVDEKMRGAFVYKDILYLFSNSEKSNTRHSGIPGVAFKVEHWYQEQPSSNFLQFILHETILE